MLTSCSISNVDEEQGFDFETLSIEQVYEVSNQINLIEKSAISTLSEEKLKKMLEPFILNGKAIYESIKKADEVDKFISSGEFDNSNLDDSFYAQLSFTYAVLTHELDNTNDSQTNKISVTQNSSSLLSCLAVALGYEAIKNLGISGLMTARGAVAILKAVGRRYFFGYIGTAYMIYEFDKCINAIKPD